jgi:uncharacterized protein YrrD
VDAEGSSDGAGVPPQRVLRSSAIGLPAISLDGAEEVGRIADLICDRRQARVIGLLLDGGGWWHRRVVPYEEVAAVGPSAVMLRRSVVLAARTGQALASRRARHARLVGRRLLTRQGEELGIVDDLVFDAASGRILGYLVSGGIVHDLMDGKRFLPAGWPMAWGRGALILADDPADWPDGGDGS